jgi:hypothetical protein
VLATRPAFDGDDGCGTQIICDDGSVNWFDDGYEETTSTEEDGYGTAVLTGSTGGAYGTAPFCPSGFGGIWIHNINVPTPQGTKVMKSFSISGLHALLSESAPGIGRYSIPSA